MDFLIAGFPFNRPRNKIERIVQLFFKLLIFPVNLISRRVIAMKTPLNNKRILFQNFQGAYTCNTKYIAEKLIQKNADLELIFVFNKDYVVTDDFPAKVNLVRKYTTEYYLILASSKVWIDNSITMLWKFFSKKKDQLYLNTWHGSLGIKKLSGSKIWKTIAKTGNRKIDYFITNSTFEENVFKNSFWPKVPCKQFGHPRNDIFFNQEILNAYKNKVFKYFNIEKDSKVFMYGPTFRKNTADVSAIKMDFKAIKKTLEEKFGGHWVILSRLHYRNSNNIYSKDHFANNPDIIDASTYPDMQELIACTDIAVTDYSSWIFDFMLTKRPGFIFAKDIAKYINSRGFYYPLSKTPFPICENDEELIKAIENFDYATYLEQVDAFLLDKNCYENGNASESVYNLITDFCNEKRNVL